jgi:hypothetical protein
MLVSVVIVAAILAVCGLYFKAVILNWLSRDAALRALNDGPFLPDEETRAARVEHAGAH